MKTCLIFSNSHQFQLTSHFLRGMGGSHRFFFWRRLPRYSHCWSVISIAVHSHLWVCPFFSYSYSPSSPGMVAVVRQGCPLRCDGTSSYLWKACLQSAWVPPSNHLPINFLWNGKSPSLPSLLMCVSLYSTLIPETVAEASTVDLPLTHSPVVLQSMLYNWFLSLYFSCLSLSC